ncbi:MAG: NUDIX hydrolase [Sphaerochaetaceae bacterium]|jgi:ADP-ribose pyrophosphatase
MSDHETLRWNSLKRRRVYDGAIFHVNTILRESKTGVQSEFVELEAPQWATIIPWYRNEEGVPHFMMVKQYRHGTDSITIEFPAGTVDKGESPKEAALRELIEETGAVPTHEIIELGSVSPNAAFMANRAYFYLAEGVEKVTEQSLDTHEDVTICHIPVQEVLHKMGTGEYDNGIMMIAQAYFIRYVESHPYLIS